MGKTKRKISEVLEEEEEEIMDVLNIKKQKVKAEDVSIQNVDGITDRESLSPETTELKKKGKSIEIDFMIDEEEEEEEIEDGVEENPIFHEAGLILSVIARNFMFE